MEKLFDKKEIMKLFGASSYLETNISELFFTEKFAYKIKKSINLGFVDFTKRSERNRISKEEFRVNKIISPKIYLKIIPILKEKNGQLTIGNSAGNSAEVAIKMVRLPEGGCLANLLFKKQVSEELVSRLAKIIFKFHSKFKSAKSVSKHGEKEVMGKNLKNIFYLLRNDYNEEILSRENVADIIKKTLFIFNEKQNSFVKRIEEEKIQRIHGDLHSENVFVKEEIPFITDATLPIPNWEYGDCAIDVGALAMDFDAYKLENLGGLLVKKYAKLRKDNSILEVIIFYKLYWALIRLWVNLLSFKHKAKGSRKKAEMYRNLVFKYLNIK